MNLHCLGCGELRISNYTGGTLAISCICGAGSPILYDPIQDKVIAQPYSLTQLLLQDQQTSVHLEYYLGYSFHINDMKTQTEELLKLRGLISQQDCDEKKCEQEYERAMYRVVDMSKDGD